MAEQQRAAGAAGAHSISGTAWCFSFAAEINTESSMSQLDDRQQTYVIAAPLTHVDVHKVDTDVLVNELRGACQRVRKPSAHLPAQRVEGWKFQEDILTQAVARESFHSL